MHLSKEQLPAFHIQACGRYQGLTGTVRLSDKLHRKVLNAFPVPKSREKWLFAFKYIMSIYIKRNGVLHCGIRAVYGNVPRAAVAFAVLPSHDSSFRCEGGSCSPHL
jgi:hypothetical protein